MERHLSSAAFLLEPVEKPEKKKETVPEPPVMQKELSDPSFLLESAPSKEQVLDEWTFDEKLSNSLESGSARSTSVPADAAEVVKPVSEAPALVEPKSVREQRQVCDLKSTLGQETRPVARKTTV